MFRVQLHWDFARWKCPTSLKGLDDYSLGVEREGLRNGELIGLCHQNIKAHPTNVQNENQATEKYKTKHLTQSSSSLRSKKVIHYRYSQYLLKPVRNSILLLHDRSLLLRKTEISKNGLLRGDKYYRNWLLWGSKYYSNRLLEWPVSIAIVKEYILILETAYVRSFYIIEV